jgi:predicted amidophosphoribosyltransferase
MIYPPKCIFCRQILGCDSELHICGNCYGKLPFAAATILSTAPGKINSCDGAICVFHYSGAVKEALLRFKFHNKPAYYRTFARLIARKLESMDVIGQYDMVIGIPLHRDREFS